MDSLDALKASGLRIGILCGGSGSEKAVSTASGQAIESACLESGLACDRFTLDADRLPEGLDPRIHLVLPIVHGVYGEDGRMSADLEAGGFSYAGSGPAASTLCFDKLVSKALASRMGLPVSPDALLFADKSRPFAEIVERTGLPFILKPRRDGSSVGLHVVREEADYHRVAPCLKGRDYLAESFLEGIDLTVGILDGKALGVVGIRPDGGLYDYSHKYTSGLSEYDVPADIPEPLQDQLCAWSCRLFRASGCRDLARVDFFLGREGKVVFLEINTLPGMTATSLLPKTASLSGISFQGLVIQWAFCALKRFRKEVPG